MVKTKNVIAALGVVAGFGVAALPLASYAVDNPQTSSHAIRATIDQVLELNVTESTTIDPDDTSSTLTVAADTPETTLVHTVSAKGNAIGGYSLTLGSSSSNTSLRLVTDEDEDFGADARYHASINIPTGTNVTANNSAWAYKKSETQGDFSGSSWTTIKAAGHEDELKAYTGNAGFDDTVYVNYGVSVSEGQAAGIYEGEVVYTLTATF